MKRTRSLISEYELLKLAKKVVNCYAQTIPSADREDVVMSLVECYLMQEQEIYDRFNGQSKESTYVIAILNRMCCGVIRKELKYWQLFDQECLFYQNQVSNSNAATFNLLIDDEISYLKKVLTLLEDGEKVISFLAFYYLLKAKPEYVQAYDPGCDRNHTMELLNAESSLSKGEIFERLASIVNIVEHRNVKADAVRMWLNKQLHTVVLRLNGPFNRANYDKDSFQVLFEYFYEEK